MTRQLVIAGALAVLTVCAVPAMAHDDYRIIGTITNVTVNTLSVKQTKDGKTISMATDEETLVTRDKKKVSLKELKRGLSVVVDANGDTLEDLVALEIRIVPSSTKAK